MCDKPTDRCKIQISWPKKVPRFNGRELAELVTKSISKCFFFAYRSAEKKGLCKTAAGNSRNK